MYFSLAMFVIFSLVYSGGHSSYEPYTEGECPQRESQEEGDSGDTGRYDYQYYPQYIHTSLFFGFVNGLL